MRKTIETADAPAAIGSYSQAVLVDKTLYCSGQIPLDPQTMQLCDGSIEQQFHQVFKNLAAVLNAAGSTFADVVKLTVYLCDLQHFAALNDVMAEYFSTPYPARAAVQVAALPKGAQVEMDAIAVLS